MNNTKISFNTYARTTCTLYNGQDKFIPNLHHVAFERKDVRPTQIPAWPLQMEMTTLPAQQLAWLMKIMLISFIYLNL